MSIDMVDLLEAAEDQISSQHATLFRIWMALNFGGDSASDTFDEIAQIMESDGWTGMDGDLVESISWALESDETIERIADRWPRLWSKQVREHTPAPYRRADCVCDGGECDPEICGCPCGHGEEE